MLVASLLEVEPAEIEDEEDQAKGDWTSPHHIWRSKGTYQKPHAKQKNRKAQQAQGTGDGFQKLHCAHMMNALMVVVPIVKTTAMRDAGG